MAIQTKMKLAFVCTAFIVLAAPLVTQANVPVTFEAYCHAWSVAGFKSALRMNESGWNYARYGDSIEYPTGLTVTECYISCDSTPEGGRIRYDMSIYADSSEYLGSNSLDITDGGVWIGTTEEYPENTPLQLIVEFDDYYHSDPLGDFQLYRGDELLFDRQAGVVNTFTLPVYAGELIDIRLSKMLNGHSHSGRIDFSVVPEPATALLLLAGLPLIRRR